MPPARVARAQPGPSIVTGGDDWNLACTGDGGTDRPPRRARDVRRDDRAAPALVDDRAALRDRIRGPFGSGRLVLLAGVRHLPRRRVGHRALVPEQLNGPTRTRRVTRPARRSPLSPAWLPPRSRRRSPSWR